MHMVLRKYRTYAVEGFGEVTLPKISIFLVMVAGFAGNHHQKG